MRGTDEDALEAWLEAESGMAKAREKGGKNAGQIAKGRELWESWEMGVGGGHEMVMGLLGQEAGLGPRSKVPLSGPGQGLPPAQLPLAPQACESHPDQWTHFLLQHPPLGSYRGLVPFWTFVHFSPSPPEVSSLQKRL